MTTKEAIKELKDASDSEVRYGDTKRHYDEVMKRIEAFDMAIKALEAYRAHEEFMEYLKNNPVGGYKGDNHNW